MGPPLKSTILSGLGINCSNCCKNKEMYFYIFCPAWIWLCLQCQHVFLVGLVSVYGAMIVTLVTPAPAFLDLPLCLCLYSCCCQSAFRLLSFCLCLSSSVPLVTPFLPLFFCLNAPAMAETEEQRQKIKKGRNKGKRHKGKSRKAGALRQKNKGRNWGAEAENKKRQE